MKAGKFYMKRKNSMVDFLNFDLSKNQMMNLRGGSDGSSGKTKPNPVPAVE